MANAGAGPAELNVAEAKRRFSDLLGRVAYGGETVVITRRGRPMARLVPPLGEVAEPATRLRGWLDAKDPFFAIIDAIVAARPRHRARTLRRQRRGRKQR